MDSATISYLVGVTGASFMSSNAMFSLFNWKLRNIRDKARKDYGKAREEHQRKGLQGKAVQAGLGVLKEDRRTAGRWYIVWLAANIAPVAVSVLLALVVSAPVVVSDIQAWADRWLVPLLKVGIWGLVVSLFVQTAAVFRLFLLRWRIKCRMEAEPDDLFER